MTRCNKINILLRFVAISQIMYYICIIMKNVCRYEHYFQIPNAQRRER